MLADVPDVARTVRPLFVCITHLQISSPFRRRRLLDDKMRRIISCHSEGSSHGSDDLSRVMDLR